MKDYKAHIPLYEIVGSDLRAICISDFDENKGNAKRIDGGFTYHVPRSRLCTDDVPSPPRD
eukprot:1643196-Lingulodinium_polyedra.AAC.1